MPYQSLQGVLLIPDGGFSSLKPVPELFKGVFTGASSAETEPSWALTLTIIYNLPVQLPGNLISRLILFSNIPLKNPGILSTAPTLIELRVFLLLVNPWHVLCASNPRFTLSALRIWLVLNILEKGTVDSKGNTREGRKTKKRGGKNKNRKEEEAFDFHNWAVQGQG